METTLGQKIAEGRKRRGIRQEDLAEQLGVSAQAVSKWENDLSCPDILLLPRIADILETSTDELLSRRPRPETVLLPESRRRDINEMTLRIHVNSADGDRVKVNLPMALVKVALEMGLSMPQLGLGDKLSGIDLSQVFALVEQGVIGKLVEVESADGDTVEIVVE